MDVGQPVTDVIPGARGAVLAALARLHTPRTGRQLARDARRPPSSTARILDDLVEAGIVLRVTHGRDNTYELNHEHLAAAAITALASLRGELVTRLREHMSSHPEIVAAWLFGSAARGDGSRTSDLDVLVVFSGDVDESVVGELAADARMWTGNPVQVVEHSVESLSLLVSEDNPLVESLRRDGVELVAGSRRYLGGAS